MILVFYPRSRIRMLTFYPSWIPDPGSLIQGSKWRRIPDPDPQHCLLWICHPPKHFVFPHIKNRYINSEFSIVHIFRKQTIKDASSSTASSFQNFKFKCAFMTCGTIFNTPSQLKMRLFRHHPDVKKDCIYNGCTYSTYNINTLRVLHF
jgi:hypothetical protein